MSRIGPVWSSEGWESIPIADRIQAERKVTSDHEGQRLSGNSGRTGRHFRNMEMCRRPGEGGVITGKQQ